MDKVLTVVVPTYNMEDYLDRCLTSLIMDEEHMAMLEVLVINDGSKDRSSEIAHCYESKYPETFKVIDKENGNYGSCVNKGMEIATGKYFRILDADDWFDTEVLISLLDRLCSINSDIVFTKGTKWSNIIKEEYGFPDYVEIDRIYDINILYNIDMHFLENLKCIRMHQMTFSTKSIIKADFKMQTGISYTDTEFCYFPCKVASTMYFFDGNLYQYNADRAGQTMDSKSMQRSISHMVQIAKRLLPDYLSTPEGYKKLWHIFHYKP